MYKLKEDFNEDNKIKSNYCECCVKKRRCPKSGSTKMSHIWNLRNDSSHVSSLLAPDNEHKSDFGDSNITLHSKNYQKRTIKSSNLSGKVSETPRHCDGCYCRDSPILPVLDSKERSQNDARYKRNGVRLNLHCSCRQKRGFGVKRISKQSDTKSNTILSDSDLKLDYTNIRNDYELNNDFRNIRNHENEDKFDDISIKLNDMPISYKEFKELSDFRKKQYFECHSLTNLSTKVPKKHKCLHKFVMNDRLLPEPVNCDSYGISRCEVCNKPMETFENTPKRQPVIKKKTNNKVKKIYEYNLMPPRLNISNGNETVQIKVPENLETECLWQCPEFKIKRKVPGNSFALRYQKGCL